MAKLKYKILDVKEHPDRIVVEVETIYGKEKLGLSLSTQYINPETGQPRWKDEVHALLLQKYGNRNPDGSIRTKTIFKEEVGKEYTLD